MTSDPSPEGLLIKASVILNILLLITLIDLFVKYLDQM